MIERRTFLGVAATLPALAAFPKLALAATHPDLSNVKKRTTGKVEVLYKTPHFGANGLELTSEGMWIIHQIEENYASLVDIKTGKLIREIQVEGIRSASGIAIDDDNVMWIGSTYNRLIVSADPKTGKAIAKYSTPGAGQIYKVKGDVEGSRTPLEPAYPRPAPPPASAPRSTGGRQGAGKQDMSVQEGPAGTGAHCILSKGNLLYVDVPPARMIYAIDKTSWEIQDMFPVAGNRPHDMTWADAGKTHLWCSDSNYNAFFLHDVATGRILEQVSLPAGSPIIHGAKLHDGYMYMCDDAGWMSRVRFS